MTTSRIEMVRKMATAPKGEIFHVSNFISFPALSPSLSLSLSLLLSSLTRFFTVFFSPLTIYDAARKQRE